MDPQHPAAPLTPALPETTNTHVGGASPRGDTALNGGAAPLSANTPGASTPAAPGAANIDATTQSEIDEAMAALGFGGGPAAGGGGGGRKTRQRQAQPPAAAEPAVVPIGGVQKPKVHGPRLVQAGREHRTGKVVSVGPTDVFIEFGPKELGVVAKAQWGEDAPPTVGTDLEVVVDKFEPAESIFLCSRPGAVQKAAWESMEVGQSVEARVTGVNKGGLELEVGGHRAFMPASQVSLDRVADLNVFIGEKMTCQVSQVDRRGRGNIVLSRRDLLDAERREKAGKLRESLKEGDELEGTVRKIMPFGAFVDVGGLDGLVHLSDLTHERIGFGEQAVGKVVKEGQVVRVKVLKLEFNEADPKKSRISLGLKQLAADPFQTALSDIAEGAEVGGRVTRLADFGAFVELAPGVEGLVHVSEIAHKRINHPQDELKPDQVVRAKVLKIDPQTRRIALSLKALLTAPVPVGGTGGGGGKKKGDDRPGRSIEEITKETPALRRLREQAKPKQKEGLKGGFGKGYDDGGGLAGLRLG